MWIVHGRFATSYFFLRFKIISDGHGLNTSLCNTVGATIATQKVRRFLTQRMMEQGAGCSDQKGAEEIFLLPTPYKIMSHDVQLHSKHAHLLGQPIM